MQQKQVVKPSAYNNHNATLQKSLEDIYQISQSFLWKHKTFKKKHFSHMQ